VLIGQNINSFCW